MNPSCSSRATSLATFFLALLLTLIAARPGNTPESALGCTLITNAAWLSYPAVGFNALDNFELTDGMVRIAIGEGSFHFIAPQPARVPRHRARDQHLDSGPRRGRGR